LHALAWTVAIVSFRVALIPAQSCRPVSVDEVSEAIVLSTSWAAANVRDDGSFTYRYSRDTGEDLGGYNAVRHAGLVNAMYQAIEVGETGPEGLSYLDAADRGLQYMLDRLVEHDHWAAFAEPRHDVRLGGTALFVASLMHRRRATDETTHDATIHAALRFLIAQQDETGAPAAFWSPSTRLPVPDRFGPFATGEAAWALALGESDFPGLGYGHASDAVISYVVNDRRDREDILIRLPDHWLSYALAERGRPLSPTEVTYTERLAGDFAVMRRVEATRTDEGVQGFLRYGHALGAGVGAMGEGIGGLWRVGRSGVALGDDLDALGAHMECVAAILVDRQVQRDMVRFDESAELGAWFKDGVTQMDDQQHSISALLAAREILMMEADAR